MDNIKLLEKELKYLTKEAVQEEIRLNQNRLESKDINIKELANEIYLKRGIDISKLNQAMFINSSNISFSLFVKILFIYIT